MRQGVQLPREGRAGRLPPRLIVLTKLVLFVTTTVGGSIGWWLGAKVGIMTAFALSMLGTGLGIYYGRKAAQHYEI